MRKLKDHSVPRRPNEIMEEVKGGEVNSVYEAYTIYNAEREARRPESYLPWVSPRLLEKERHVKMKDGMRAAGVWATKGVVLVYDQSGRIVGGQSC